MPATTPRRSQGDGTSVLRAVPAPEPSTPRRRLVALTDEQIAVLQAALSYWERAVADTSYDPQVGEWARTHRTETGTNAAAVRKALTASAPDSDW